MTLAATPVALRTLLGEPPKQVIPLSMDKDLVRYFFLGDSKRSEILDESFLEEIRFLLAFGAVLQAGGVSQSPWLDQLRWILSFLKGEEGYEIVRGTFPMAFEALPFPQGWQQGTNRGFGLSTVVEGPNLLGRAEAPIFGIGFNEGWGMAFIEGGMTFLQLHVQNDDFSVPAWFLDLWKKFDAFIG